MRSARPLLLLVFLTLPVSAIADDGEPYRWPLDQPRVLTSSFGEYRSSGYHMGIDLRTGPIGKHVFAPAPGYVERIRCSPYGYGKAVYFRLDDGHIFVYAHLNDYAETLRRYVRQEQHRRERYEVDLYPDKNRFRFERGDLIAFSGQTGIGAPHLHFEVRNGAGIPIDPRTIGFDWPDTTPPTIRGVAVEPATPHSAINGQYLPVTLSPRSAGSGLVTDGIGASGPIRFAISATDTDGAAGTRLGVAGGSVTAGTQDVFHLQFSRIPYDTYRDGVVAFHPYIRGSGRYLTFWPWPDNRVPAYAYADGTGIVDPASELATVVVRDAHANQRSVQIPITLAALSDVAGPAQSTAATGTVRFEPVANWLVCVVRFNGPEAVAPVARISGGDVEERTMVRVSAQEFQLPVTPAPDAEQLIVTLDHPRLDSNPWAFGVLHRGTKPAVYEQAGLRIEGSAGSAFGTLIFSAKRVERQSASQLRAVGDAFSVWHENHPIAEPLRITLPVPDGADLSRVHVYRQGSGWSRQSTEKSADGMTIETRRLGLFQAFEDRHAPYLNVTSPPQGYHAKTKRPILTARVADAHSGVDGFGATANGEWLLVAYDPEHGELRWDRDEDLPSGTQLVEFWASDHAGNVNRKTVTVVIP